VLTSERKRADGATAAISASPTWSRRTDCSGISRDGSAFTAINGSSGTDEPLLSIHYYPARAYF
jgi:hypothetical protein